MIYARLACRPLLTPFQSILNVELQTLITALPQGMREQNIAEIKGVALIEMMNKFGDFSSKDGGVVFMFRYDPGLDA